MKNVVKNSLMKLFHLKLIFIISLILNIILGYLYFGNNCENTISDLQVRIQNLVSTNSQLLQEKNGIYQEVIKLSSDIDKLSQQDKELKKTLKKKNEEIVSSQKMIIHLKNQIVNVYIKADSLKVTSQPENTLSIPINFYQDFVLFNGTVKLIFDKNLSSNIVKQHYLGMNINAILKQDPFQIITSLVREKKTGLLKSYVKLNRINKNGEIIKSDDWLESSKTIFNPDTFRCPDPDMMLSLNIGYSPIAGMIALGFNKWSLGVINTFDTNQQSYVVMYRVFLKDLFKGTVSKILF